VEPVPASATDVFSHHLARQSETRMTVVAHCDAGIDIEAMRRALAMLMEEEPILRAGMEHDDGWLIWVHRPDIGVDDVLEEQYGYSGDGEEFCFGAVDPHRPPLWGLVIARQGHCDTVALSMAHALGDGRALMHLFERLMTLYLDPEAFPGPAASLPSRDLSSAFSDGEMERLAAGGAGPFSSWPSLYRDLSMTRGRMALRSLDADSFSAARGKWKREEGATVNDVLMAAMALTLRDLTGEGGEASVSATVDNRQYMSSRAPKIANMSANFALHLGDVTGMEMPAAIREVNRGIEALRREGRLGKEDLASFASMEGMDEMDELIDTMCSGDEGGRSLYFITNVGILDWDTSIDRSLGIRRAYMAYPGISPPTLGVVCCGHNGELHLSMGHYEGLPAELADELLETVLRYVSG